MIQIHGVPFLSPPARHPLFICIFPNLFQTFSDVRSIHTHTHKVIQMYFWFYQISGIILCVVLQLFPFSSITSDISVSSVFGFSTPLTQRCRKLSLEPRDSAVSLCRYIFVYISCSSLHAQWKVSDFSEINLIWSEWNPVTSQKACCTALPTSLEMSHP